MFYKSFDEHLGKNQKKTLGEQRIKLSITFQVKNLLG